VVEIGHAGVNGETRQFVCVDTCDYDGLCELVAWCGGVAVDEGDAVIAIESLGERVLARDGDAIVRQSSGGFSVVPRELLHPSAAARPGWGGRCPDAGRHSQDVGR
jgi:hypothetical protein